MQRDSRRRLAILLCLGSSVFVSACAANGHRMSKYRRNPQLGRALESRAAEICSSTRREVPPRTFSTDGCTGWPDASWGACCVTHDIRYWCGGSAEDRRQADSELSACVTGHAGPVMGVVMYFGVRLGGPPWLPVPWRWSYGWSWYRGYEDLVTLPDLDAATALPGREAARNAGSPVLRPSLQP